MTLIVSNILSIRNEKIIKEQIIEILIKQFEDSSYDVQKSASIAFSRLIMWGFIQKNEYTQYIHRFKTMTLHNIKMKEVVEDNLLMAQMDHDDQSIKHGGILGLCAFILASTKHVPSHLPDVISFLANHLNDSPKIKV